MADNHLDRQFAVQRPNQVYAGDITYIHTQEGWLYLAVVIDLFSRQIVGWSMAEHMRTKLVNDALLMAIWKRKPAQGLLWHTDRGSQYASESHRALLKQHGICQRYGNALLAANLHLKLRPFHCGNFDFGAHRAIRAANCPDRVVDFDFAVAVFDRGDQIESAADVLGAAPIQ
ncbi:hypothetical protein C2U68_16495 [Methylomonas koyamae]|nr:hypothetical protein C2U68_16495 [Methylomonas koyamae]